MALPQQATLPRVLLGLVAQLMALTMRMKEGALLETVHTRRATLKAMPETTFTRRTMLKAMP